MGLDQLAGILPVIMAGFSRSPQTVQQTISNLELGRQHKYERALEEFGKEVFQGGDPSGITEKQIAEAARKHGIQPMDALKLTSNFLQYKRMKRGELRPSFAAMPGGGMIERNYYEGEGPEEGFIPGKLTMPRPQKQEAQWKAGYRGQLYNPYTGELKGSPMPEKPNDPQMPYASSPWGILNKQTGQLRAMQKPGGGAGAGGSAGGFKISDINSTIGKIMSNYKGGNDLASAFAAAMNGGDMSAAMGTADTIRTRIEKEADAGSQQAKHDLVRLDYLYRKMDQFFGIQQPTVPQPPTAAQPMNDPLGIR